MGRSHLRLVFLKAAGPTINKLLAMQNPQTARFFFNKETAIISKPGEHDQVTSTPMSRAAAEMALETIHRGRFPNLMEYRVVSSGNEKSIYGEEQAIWVKLRSKNVLTSEQDTFKNTETERVADLELVGA